MNTAFWITLKKLLSQAIVREVLSGIVTTLARILSRTLTTKRKETP